MSSVIDINNYHPLESDRFFFDTNIWMYLLCPIASYRRDTIKKYDGFLKRVMQSKSSIFISSLVLSEFFNAYTRLEFNMLKREDSASYRDFKRDFRGTEKYKKLVTEIKTTIRTKILKISERISDKFADIDLDKILENIEEADFNDNYHKVLLPGEDIKIVTDDYDFVKVDESISVITANLKLLEEN